MIDLDCNKYQKITKFPSSSVFQQNNPSMSRGKLCFESSLLYISTSIKIRIPPPCLLLSSLYGKIPVLKIETLEIYHLFQFLSELEWLLSVLIVQ